MTRLKRLFAIYGFVEGASVIAHRLVLKRLIPLLKPVAHWRLKRLLPKGARIIIVRSTLDWAYPYSQRVHHLAREWVRQGRTVVFVSPSTGHDRVLVASSPKPGLVVTPHGAAALAAAERPLYLALSTDATLTENDADRVRACGGTMIYDYIDHMDDAVSGRPNPPERLRLHERLLADEETIVLASADALLREVAGKRRRNYSLVTNGVDVEHFKGVSRERVALRADFAALVGRGRPMLGYYGSLASWFDYELVRRLAQERPGCDVVLIGPDIDGTSSALVGRPPNLFVLPAMRYEDLPSHAVWFDVCLVPFVVNDITLATSPLKIFEYMALSRSTVSTDLPECRKYRSVLIADADGFAEACDRALSLKDDPAFRAIALAECEENNWAWKVSILAEEGMPCRRDSVQP